MALTTQNWRGIWWVGSKKQGRENKPEISRQIRKKGKICWVQVAKNYFEIFVFVIRPLIEGFDDELH